jgi:MoxR-like ATPase
MNSPASSIYESLRQEIKKTVLGQEALIEQALIGFLAGGHIILEGAPGLAKTLFARTLAGSLALTFKRIQFTPDLMPSDLTGTNVFQPDKQQFHFLPGPVFTDILLADEINRTPPKTQSALLEAMEEKQVTVDGINHPLSENFFVIATQNPIEFEGTFPLPEAQIDRFLLKISISYPTPADELQILKSQTGLSAPSAPQPRVSAADLAQVRAAIAAIRVEDTIYDYLLKLVLASRQSAQLALGASPRAALGWIKAAKVLASLRGRGFVTPDDIKELAAPVLRHRLVLKPESEIEGVRVEEVIAQILASVEIPR